MLTSRCRVIQGMFRTTATCLGIIVVVAIIFPIFLVVVPPLAFFYLRVMTFVTHPYCGMSGYLLIHLQILLVNFA